MASNVRPVGLRFAILSKEADSERRVPQFSRVLCARSGDFRRSEGATPRKRSYSGVEGSAERFV